MNWIFSALQIRKLFLTGLCICFLIGSILFASSSALAVSLLPPGEYDLPKEGAVTLPADIRHYSPYVDPPFPQRVFWGDVHLHTVYSFDAGAAGSRLGPEDSYRFARGEEIETESTQRVRLSRPLDFLVVTDHSDGLGSFQQLLAGEPPEILEDPTVARWHEMVNGTPEEQVKASQEIIAAFAQGTLPEAIYPQKLADFATAWQAEIDAAENYNDPGLFTAMIGYEWTSLPSGNNLHRNIIFRDNGVKASKVLPFTTENYTDPEKLWQWMQCYENTIGGNVLAIPHNGNLSNGLMFADTQFNNVDPTQPGEPLTKEYAQQRQLWEPLYEVTQIKGTGETHPLLSTDDEFANFEVEGWDNGNLDLSAGKPEDPEAKKEMYEHEYARAALKNGLKFEAELGANPFKFGLVGATDSHIALSAVEENNYFGKFVDEAPNPDRAIEIRSSNQDGSIVRVGWQYAASGYVGVWAKQNTREAIFDAMEKREVYATSGPRMVVRFFGGWDFTNDDLSSNPGDVGYTKGVPMGSDLNITDMPEGKAPTFLVAAWKDPLRGNLDRIQIVKGWLDASGETHEKVYDVAWSGDRVPDATTGKLPPVGNTVNTETATWTNTIGASELEQVWTDPDFEPNQRAFYYARVLEIPTPRWTDYDKAFYGDKWCAEAEAENPGACDDIPLTLQERVYTSPIWYSPA
ncbi:DUF3604 domain-containing protein [Microseira wollei]|uniref:DUF3604 domain-containing protein n=1 Tax=Microseira wollei NIES-4236 TaxID=2530354 RepID=A0AAV3XPQ2_9CYAN|nr:DUF3604 domain-containing protein [Microseira wollei]GET43895.1 hypothetical protein MiSe_87210 [Microseira wollei NIES-4236]